MKRPPFEEIKKFNAEVWPLFREYFTNGNFTMEEAKEFLENHRVPTMSDYVIFRSIPNKLREIITPEHAYFVCDVSPGQTKVSLDNDFAHWIDNVRLRICPVEEIERRRVYAQRAD